MLDLKALFISFLFFIAASYAQVDNPSVNAPKCIPIAKGLHTPNNDDCVKALHLFTQVPLPPGNGIFEIPQGLTVKGFQTCIVTVTCTRYYDAAVDPVESALSGAMRACHPRNQYASGSVNFPDDGVTLTVKTSLNR